MALTATVENITGSLPAITFKWDDETEILAGHFKGSKKAGGLTGSVELEGADGSFIVLDVADGAVQGLEVVVWPPVQTVAALKAPASAVKGRLTLPARRSQPNIAAVEVETALSVEKSADHATLHIRVGRRRDMTASQIADNLVVELDAQGGIAGFWLLNVPPPPADLQ